MVVLTFFLVLLCLSLFCVSALSASQTQTPPKIGNFAFRGSQQLSPLISFGQLVIDKGETMVFLTGSDFIGHKAHQTNITPSLLYGVTDNFSLSFFMPIAASYKDHQDHSSGLEDMYFQAEYAFYNKVTSQYEDMATVVANMTFPTGSTHKNPTTGVGSPSFFLGATLSRHTAEWYVFTSHGATLTTSHHRTKFGNEFLYQFGLGKVLYTIDSRWLFGCVVEMDGEYSGKDKIMGMKDNDSGGNVIYATPSLWLSSQSLILQLGIGFPVTQHLFGEQTKANYLVAGSITWAF